MSLFLRIALASVVVAPTAVSAQSVAPTTIVEPPPVGVELLLTTWAHPLGGRLGVDAVAVDSGDGGWVDLALGLAGLGPARLLYTDTAMYIGITYAYLPFMILPLYARLSRRDPALEEAAADLGATPWTTFRTVTWPLSLPGVAAGLALVFIPAVGEYVIPELLGGPGAQTIGRALWNEFFANRDWPMAATVANALLLALLVPMVVLRTRP